ncbi:cellulase family glycosylhydrolase [Vibrio sp. MEBiC08052]|uniref:cellulase family glycosylhydrolase n=1 Tax=Vibrio sp. MEBiC08052 TaxID=1761910 RepID=UPI0007405AE5|nr:cellulase family glycosylhydrolase [Vibrio sp. MEBiC08052]KUI97173.1 Cellulase [Vibrio sp. MEBiC08052]
MSYLPMQRLSMRKNNSSAKKLLLSCLGCLFIGLSQQAYAVEPLSVSGNKIYAGDEIKSFSGNSLFWSNNEWGGEKFYRADIVKMLREEWNASLVRASMGIQEDGGYLDDPAGNKAKVITVVDAAIANDMYVIIDWHSHHAEDNVAEAVSFFREMAQKYGDSPNVIYEIYNEPLQISWDSIIKPYAETVIAAIREFDPDNLIIVGTPSWSQDVDTASWNPINGTNIAYTLHFYAGTHGQFLRDKAITAMNNGIALFVTEWGTINANGDGDVNEAETDVWVNFMKEHDLSNANWALNDKDEGASTYYPDTMTLTPSGKKVKSIIANWPYKLENRTQKECTGVNVYPNWTRKSWEGGNYDHSDNGDYMVYQDKLYQANWYTKSTPGSDNSWSLTGICTD